MSESNSKDRENEKLFCSSYNFKYFNFICEWSDNPVFGRLVFDSPEFKKTLHDFGLAEMRYTCTVDHIARVDNWENLDVVKTARETFINRVVEIMGKN
jgi:hypothetical protein